MVFFFDVPDTTATGRAGYTVYMGADSAENDQLIEWGWRSDIWFHVDSLSSAHVYLRLRPEDALCGCQQRCGCLLEKVSEEIVDEMCQLVKANSISGVKMSSVSVVYTPHSNLRKESGIKEGSVSFHSAAHRRLKMVEKDRDLVKRLEKTRREATPDLQRERMQFERQCVEISKVRRQAAAKAAADADPRKKQRDKAKEHEQFLAGGGYHSAALAAREAEQKAESVWGEEEDADGGATDTLVIGGDDDGAVASAEPEPDAAAEEEEEPRSHAEEAQLRRAEPDADVRWLRERGYDVDAARTALQAADDAGKTTAGLERRIAALSALQPRELSEDMEPDAEEAAEGRAEEREALESILGEDVLIALGGDAEEVEHRGIPVQGFEPAEDDAGDAPPLMLEIYIDKELAAPGYPLGNALPLVAVTGGGLLEQELRTLTPALVAHAVENLEMGPVTFELMSCAEEKATELVEQREQRATALAQRRADAKRRAENLAQGGPKGSKGGGGGKGRAAAAAGGGAAKPKIGAPSEASAAARRRDAQSRLGKFGEGKASSTFVTVNEVPTEAADVLGGGGGVADKGGYVSKKKKKKK